MKEPPLYNLLSSFLHCRPLSRPTLCTLEGGAVTTSPALEAADVSIGPATESDPDDPPEVGPTGVRMSEQPTPPSTPARTRRRLRPPTGRQQLVETVKVLATYFHQRLDDNKQYNDTHM